MNHDIFISYSRKDSAQAIALVEQLTAQGFTVWIDQRGIEASDSWSKEIVDAIDGCKVFAVLVSSASMTSKHVIREISLAQESGRSLLPIDLEEILLPNEVRYQLAGIQRVPLAEFDRIVLGLGRHGLFATSITSTAIIQAKKDARKSLLVLPFQDLSPGQDNLWFADGLAGELIDSLSQLKELRLIDRKTSSTLRHSPLQLYEIAKTVDVRYVIEGSVRKFNDQLKISISLLDVTEGEHLWQYSRKGIMDDIFEIQEQVAEKVVEGLKLHLTKSEEEGIAKRGTESVEAYTLFLRAMDYSRPQTLSSIHMACDLARQALKHDPFFIPAASLLANLLIREYENYAGQAVLLEEAEQIVSDLMTREPLSRFVLNAYCWLLFAQHDTEKAIEVGLVQLQHWPQYGVTYATLGQAYALARRFEEADAIYAKGQKVDETYLTLYWNAMTDAGSAGNLVRRSQWAYLGVQFFERHLLLNPDDETSRIQYITILEAIGRKAEAREALEKLTMPTDVVSAYNLACLATTLGEYHRAIELLRNCLAQENNLNATISSDAELDPLRELPEFQALMEQPVAVTTSSTNKHP